MACCREVRTAIVRSATSRVRSDSRLLVCAVLILLFCSLVVLIASAIELGRSAAMVVVGAGPDGALVAVKSNGSTEAVSRISHRRRHSPRNHKRMHTS